jgi:DNA (cytosine-5)-methyltransferase 1
MVVEGDGAWWDGRDTAEALTTTSNEQRMPDKQRFQAVVEGFTPSSFANYAEGVGTLRSNGGDLGGGSETLIAEPYVKSSMLSFDTQFGSNANVTEDIAPTLKSSQQSPSVAYPIDTGNAVAYDEYNDSVNEIHHALRAGTKQSTGVLTSPTLTAYNMDSRSPQSEEQQRIVNAVFESTMAVRRLTPLECERLMGWPDNHTLTKADGTIQADSHRYKQCGNGVASPVAQWIAKHILAI